MFCSYSPPICSLIPNSHPLIPLLHLKLCSFFFHIVSVCAFMCTCLCVSFSLPESVLVHLTGWSPVPSISLPRAYSISISWMNISPLFILSYFPYLPPSAFYPILAVLPVHLCVCIYVCSVQHTWVDAHDGHRRMPNVRLSISFCPSFEIGSLV